MDCAFDIIAKQYLPNLSSKDFVLFFFPGNFKIKFQTLFLKDCRDNMRLWMMSPSF